MNGIIDKLKTDRKFLLLSVGLIISTFIIPYIIIPGLILWWFYKKSKITKKTKIITTAVVGGLLVMLIIMGFMAYAKDVEPHLNVTEPAATSTVKVQQVVIKGTYEPSDRKVWVNGKEISASGGNLEYTYELKEGENKLDVSAGNWKRTHVYLTVIRELTEKEKSVRVKPTPTPTNTPTATQAPAPASTPTSTAQSNLYTVSSVIDGDTIQVLIDAKKETLRLIGIDTPETVDPRKPVQCFGKEASAKAKSLLSGKSVRLESDPTQGERDKYQRLLRYVFLEDGTNFNKLMISEGYAYEYTYNIPYKYQVEFKQAQRDAEAGKKGLWADNACLSPTSTPKSSPTTTETSDEPSNDSGSFTCAGKTKCDQMTSCAEANFYLNTCEVSRLDGDKDGVPCESLCR